MKERIAMSDKAIIIIGGGIAGLAAGCYGQMNGFRTHIFEMHKKKPGGLCTSWKRQGYTVNGCIHWLVGSGPRSKFYSLWEELGAVQGREFVYHEEYGRVEFLDGKRFIVYSDIDRLEQHMRSLAPEDGPVIDEFIAVLRRCTRFDAPVGKAPEVSTVFDLLKMIITNLPLLLMLWKWSKVSLTEYGNRFKNPLMRAAFPLLFMPDFPMSFMFMTLAWMHNKCAGYPIGGSLEFSRAIENRYLALGGEMTYKGKVVKIITENDRAVGIKLEDGSEHFADYVISASDGHTTIFEMLEGKYVDDVIQGYYNTLIPFPPLVQVALGVNRSFKELPTSNGNTFELADPFLVGGVEQKHLDVHIYNFDPTLAPEGKTLLTVMFQTDFDYWRKLRENDEQYKAEKEKIADTVVAHLDKHFPGFAAQVEMRDIASPTTFVRYTGNWKGSFEGWQVTPKSWRIGRLMRKTLPGLENFYMAGHWVEPGGGIPTVAMSGRNVVQIICKKEKKKFTTVK
jgi:phytoene dehydrogenase-like protein